MMKRALISGLSLLGHNMRPFRFFLIITITTLVLAGQASAQTYNLGAAETGTSTSNTTMFGPIGRGYLGSVVELIYLKSELGNGATTGQVTSLQFHHISGVTTSMSNVVVYMKHTSLTSLGSTAYTASTTGYTQVYSGSLAATAGWKSIPTAGFSYNGIDNLSVLIVRTGDNAPAPDYWSVQTSGSPANMCAYSVGSSGVNYNLSLRLAKRPSTIITIAQCMNPSSAGMAAGDWLFTGKISSEYENPANWLKWDGTAFSAIGTYSGQSAICPPQITDNVWIKPIGTCIFNQPVTTNLDPLGGGFTAPQSVTANSKNLVIESGATLAFSGNPSHFHVAEAWTNRGTLIPANGRVKFIGTGVQSINNPSGAETFYEMNIGAGSVTTINCDVTVTNALRLNGIGVTGSKFLHLTNTAADATVIPAAVGHIYGNLRRSVASNTLVYTFPVGVGTTLNTDRRQLQYINNNATGFTYLESSVSNAFKGSGANIDASLDPNKAKHYLQTFTQVCGDAEWTLTPNTSITGGSYGVRLYLANLSPLSDNCFEILKRPSSSTSFFDFDSFYLTAPIPLTGAAGRIYSGGAGYAEKTGFTSFSKFAIASSPVPLPVNLTHFAADCVNDQVALNWTTASEQNSQKFIVEKSRDMDSWFYVTELPAAGNSGIQINYAMTDLHPFPGISYYRLNQVDNDGKSKLYGPVSVPCGENHNGISIYPNPSSHGFKIEISSQKNQHHATIEIIDLTGKIILSNEINILHGINQFPFNAGLNAGTYVIRIKSEGDLFAPQKLVVQ